MQVKNPESFSHPEDKEPEHKPLRIIAVPAFGVDRKELDSTPEDKTFPPNKTLAYWAKKTAREQQIKTIYADNQVGVGDDYAEEVVRPQRTREYESTLYWAQELAKLVKEKHGDLNEVQIIVVAAPPHQNRCRQDLESVGFKNIEIETGLNQYGAQAFFDSSSDHVQTKNDAFYFVWESSLQTLKKISPKLYEKLSLGKNKI